jgi:hypothetical protein
MTGMLLARHWKIAIALLGVSVMASLLTFPALLRTVLPLQSAAATEEQARREILQPVLSSPTDTREKARLFWASSEEPTVLEPFEIELSLSAEPVPRAKQLIAALIADAPSPEQQTLPPATVLLQFYLLPDGTAIADFSDSLATATPAGILSEQMVVDSLTRTLQANVSGVRQLKILIRGQDVETLAGHLDLTGFFPVALPQPPEPPTTPGAPVAPASLSAPSGAP